MIFKLLIAVSLCITGLISSPINDDKCDQVEGIKDFNISQVSILFNNLLVEFKNKFIF
jgi:hypothetical protein